MNGSADLHIHTYYSDGTMSPGEVLQEARDKGLVCVAVTDHDTVEGIGPSLTWGERLGIEVVAGIELSAEMDDRPMDILGYFMDIRHPALQERLVAFRRRREERMRQMIERLRTQGITGFSFDDIAGGARGGSLGRPHLAAMLVEKGWVRDTREAFEKYLSRHHPAYVPKLRQSPQEAIALIHEAGGVAVMAHPMITRRDEVIGQLSGWGLDGIEVYYPNCSPTVTGHYAGLARQYGLLISGGSDAHGAVKPSTAIGKATVPYERVEQLRQRAARYAVPPAQTGG